MTGADEVPPGIEHEDLGATVATFARRVQWVVGEGDDQNSHDNL